MAEKNCRGGEMEEKGGEVQEGLRAKTAGTEWRVAEMEERGRKKKVER